MTDDYIFVKPIAYINKGSILHKPRDWYVAGIRISAVVDLVGSDMKLYIHERMVDYLHDAGYLTRDLSKSKENV